MMWKLTFRIPGRRYRYHSFLFHIWLCNERDLSSILVIQFCRKRECQFLWGTRVASGFFNTLLLLSAKGRGEKTQYKEKRKKVESASDNVRLIIFRKNQSYHRVEINVTFFYILLLPEIWVIFSTWAEVRTRQRLPRPDWKRHKVNQVRMDQICNCKDNYLHHKLSITGYWS